RMALPAELQLCFFFFQAEDGIRDRNVTGVQTCALPISVETAVANRADDGDPTDGDPDHGRHADGSPITAAEVAAAEARAFAARARSVEAESEDGRSETAEGRQTQEEEKEDD